MSRLADSKAAQVMSDPRWASIAAREANADGEFYYSVRTTGVYCRPSCGSRTPRPENIRFFPTAEEAESAGFRPCKRCKPDQPPLGEQHAELVAGLCRQIESSDVPPSLTALARIAGMSTFHFHRVFRAVTGITPKAYALNHRAEKIRELMARSKTVTDAIYEAGFGSNGRFYEESDRLLGMTPR